MASTVKDLVGEYCEATGIPKHTRQCSHWSTPYCVRECSEAKPCTNIPVVKLSAIRVTGFMDCTVCEEPKCPCLVKTTEERTASAKAFATQGHRFLLRNGGGFCLDEKAAKHREESLARYYKKRRLVPCGNPACVNLCTTRASTGLCKPCAHTPDLLRRWDKRVTRPAPTEASSYENVSDGSPVG